MTLPFQSETIAITVDDKIALLTIDDPTQGANTMRAQFVTDYAAAAAALEASKDSIKGIIVTSGKSTFFAGGDLNELVAATAADADKIAAMVGGICASMTRIETLGIPVVAALNGTALGGGFEIALACHHRIAIDDGRAKFGFPEVTLGLLPGAGGVVRTVRMLGVVDACQKLLLQGQQMGAEQAKAVGIVDVVVNYREAMFDAAKKFINDNPKSVQAWRERGYRIPGGTPTAGALRATLPAIPSTLRKQTKGAHYQAPHNIMAAAVEGAMVDVERAFEIEARYFVDLVCASPQSKNMIQAFFFDLQAINKGASRPEGFAKRPATKVAVLGAGMMGAGIAYQCAKSGLEVVLKDTSVAAAEKGKDYARGLVDKGISRKKIDAAKGEALLARITPTDDNAALAGCDLVIEAVFESPDLKKKIFGEIESIVAPDALLASNTSTLPITDLATGVKRPRDFIGLHFFSPVDKMPLVEIVRGKETSPEALARAIDVVQQIRKTPIVVEDSRGFFTSRVIGCFLNEAVAMLGEGVSPVMIERAGLAAGYPAGPLQLVDELTLTLPLKIAAQYEAAAGEGYVAHHAVAILQTLVDAGRPGRSGGAGFYDYADKSRGALWPGLFELFNIPTSTAIADDDAALFVDLQERMLFGEAIETVKCFDEGVLKSHADANIGSIMGIGFPAWTGGLSQYIDQYAGGVAGFVERAKVLAERYGERFTPPASLVAVAKSNKRFRDVA